MNSKTKEYGKKAAKLWAAKKGLQSTGSLLKMGVIAGLGYLGYKYYKNNSEKINSKFS